jgi:entericidin B
MRHDVVQSGAGTLLAEQVNQTGSAGAASRVDTTRAASPAGANPSASLIRGRLMARLIALLLFVTAGATTLSACNTVSGAGQDISAGGHAISNTADKAKE